MPFIPSEEKAAFDKHTAIKSKRNDIFIKFLNKP
jgi:hypothetical protein